MRQASTYPTHIPLGFIRQSRLLQEFSHVFLLQKVQDPFRPTLHMLSCELGSADENNGLQIGAQRVLPETAKAQQACTLKQAKS